MLSLRHQHNRILCQCMHANVPTYEHTHKHETGFCAYDDGDYTIRANSSVLPIAELKHHSGF